MTTNGPLGRELAEALRRMHEAVCVCPFDGSDDGCNLSVSGARLGDPLRERP